MCIHHFHMYSEVMNIPLMGVVLVVAIAGIFSILLLRNVAAGFVVCVCVLSVVGNKRGTAQKERRGSTTQAVNTAKDWPFASPLSFAVPAAVFTNPWKMKGSPIGTSSSVSPKRTAQYHEPRPLPAEVLKRSATTTSKGNKESSHKAFIWILKEEILHRRSLYSCKPSPTTELVPGYRPLLEVLKAHGASMLARKHNTSRPLKFTLSPQTLWASMRIARSKQSS